MFLEVKGLKKLIKFLKSENKESNRKFDNLAEQIKQLIQKLKYDDNIKPQISEILQLLGFSDESIQNIVNNGEGYFLEKNKK